MKVNRDVDFEIDYLNIQMDALRENFLVSKRSENSKQDNIALDMKKIKTDVDSFANLLLNLSTEITRLRKEFSELKSDTNKVETQ